ncbi:efflux RND transporter periplasmic adaptor subunit [Iningainema tapete]|uniref:Efflux RND transporter periplasmic adaptor subunit n=1 Tax=Iningainema tapete BLCC-T55 TaxID=2748662 RepID=A0A8J6Y0S5_9CYAN|nr:efflux RND transporter periplasmic adaptor subunit [Iningainema tapete BLCC-T55]
MGEESYSELEVEEPVVEESSWQRKKVRRQRKPWLLPLFVGIGLGVAVGIGGLRLLSNRPTTQSPTTNKVTQAAPTMTVTVASVETTRVARVLNTTGTVAARDLTPILPQVNGLQIKQILVNVGNSVQAGQVMAVLDDSILQEQIRQAKADVESKQADVASKQADLVSKQAAVTSVEAAVKSNEAVVQQKQADLGQANARLKDAQINFKRTQQLVNQGALSRQQLDTAVTTLDTATEGVRLAEANIRSAEANVSSATANIGSAQANVRIAVANVNSAQAAVRSSAAKVEQLKTQLGQTLVRAPVAGIVAEKLARVGDVTGVPPQTQVATVVGGSQKLFSIIQDGQLELQALVPEVQLPQVKIGATTQVTLDADSRVRLQGQVKSIEPVVNQQRREATVKIDLPPNSPLKPGMFARAAITTTTTTGMAIPQKAVLPQADGGVIVFMLSGEDTVRAMKVEVGEILIGGRVEIKRGLKLGDRVVVDGAGYVKDGDRVRVVNNQQPQLNSP